MTLDDKETNLDRPGPDSESSISVEAGPNEKRSGENTGPHPGLTTTKNEDSSDRSPAELEDGKQQRRAHQEDDHDADDENGSGEGVLSRVASRVITKVTTKSSFNPGPPPNGGLQAWTAGT